jgi:hypothetical protein
MRLSLLAAILPLGTMGLAKPISRANSSTGSRGVLKPETYTTIQALFNASGIPGGILAISSPDGDEVMPMGVKSQTGERVEDDVSLQGTGRLGVRR